MEFRFWPYQHERHEPEERADPPAAQILPGLWYIGSSRCCSYLLHTDAGPVVVDTCDGPVRAFFLSQIARAGADPGAVVAILHTHGHSDHAGNTRELVSLSGAQAVIGAGDAPWLAQQVPVARMLCPGEVVGFGDTEFRFLHTPGHTLGCGMYLTRVADRAVCFMGDACGPFIFQEVRWGGDAEAFRASAQRMKTVQADVFLPGHPHQIFEVSPSGDPRLTTEQWHRYIDGRLRAMEQIISGSEA